jgi:Smg protein
MRADSNRQAQSRWSIVAVIDAFGVDVIHGRVGVDVVTLRTLPPLCGPDPGYPIMNDPMNDNVLDILIYLFENFLESDTAPQPSRDVLREELEHAGFAETGIERALEWLEGLASDTNDAPAVRQRSFRAFSGFEMSRLSTEVRGYLSQLEQIGILPAQQRELVIDRLMALEAEEIEIEQVKWVVLMVLFSQPGQEQAYQRMEDLVFEGPSDALH